MKNGYEKWTFFIYFRQIEDTRKDASTAIKSETLTTTPHHVIQADEIASLKNQTSVTT